MATPFYSSSLIYGMPIDSPELSNTDLQPRYFMHHSAELTIDYRDFMQKFKTRGGQKYRIRRDLGLSRVMSYRALLPNLEMIHWNEYFQRFQRNEMILPIWAEEIQLVSHSGLNIVVSSLERDLSIGDYVLLLAKDYTKYSIRQLMSANTVTKQLTLDTSPAHTYVEGDFFLPMMVGYPQGESKSEKSSSREKEYIDIQLMETPTSQERTLLI